MTAAGGIEVAPLNPSGSVTGRFARLDAGETGLDFVNELLPHNLRNYLLNGAGVASGDFDNDGQVDLFAVSQDGSNRLFRQTAAWQFSDVTEAAGGLGGGDLWGTGASFADVNNDGWLDLYVGNLNGPNHLYINQQDGTFVEQAAARNVDHDGATTMGSFADYDCDGDLDLYLVNNRKFALDEEHPTVEIRRVGERATVHPAYLDQYFLLGERIEEAGQQDLLLQNDGNGYFTDVTEQAGIAGYDMGLSAIWWDYDDDGWLDLYVANDKKTPDHLYRNQGNGQFEDVLAELTRHTPWFSMGGDSADINNDGLADLLVADMSSTTHYKQKTTMGEMSSASWFLTTGRPRQFMRNMLLVNSGAGRFYEAANLAGLDSTDWSWSVKLADFDSDSLVDVFVTNGIARNVNDSDMATEHQRLVDAGRNEEARAQINAMPPLQEANLAFRNLGDLEFADVSGRWGIDHIGVSHGATVADVDRDGDLDLIVNNMNERLSVYRNDVAEGNNVVVRLVGTQSNRFGVGAKVTIIAGGVQQVRWLSLARGYMSGDEPLLHFGLGDTGIIEEIQVTWPGGTHQQFRNVDANQLITITEGTSGKVSPGESTAPQPCFTERSPEESGLDFQHVEFEIDDFQLQPLLPNKLSQLGPGMAWGDVNGDGHDDCFVGGSSRRAGQLFLRQPGGRFYRAQGSFGEDYEDMGSLLFDADGDNDLDLYVVSAGYEREPESDLLQDRLYLNDGTGKFAEAPAGSLPQLRASGSCVTAADYDRDGDLDLFVGSRTLPRQWPLPASSFLLENRNGDFADVTADQAAALQDIGLVTGAVWSDVDADGWVDLLVTLEWGPIRLLRNEEGRLVDATQQAGLSGYQGWWNSITGGDLDNDGDIDFVAMNAGLNSKYDASAQHPVLMYAGDFDDSGTLDLVEAEWEGDVYFPVRGRSCSSHAMPFLQEKFPTYHEFALADLAEVYSELSLERAQRLEASHLASVVLLNDGQGRFEVRDLPRLAQISPGFGVVIEDFDGDGWRDVCIAQNFLHPQPETGQLDGGMGQMLRGPGNGQFIPLSPL
ncbi:MAG: VCBS repeat-containing protein, partial [Pirellulaceae bacterium]